MSTLNPSLLPLCVTAAGETDRGLRRSCNEDAVLLRADLGLYIVADGAGGQDAGNVASALAATTVAKYFDQTEPQFASMAEVDAYGLWTSARRLSAAVQRANVAVVEIAQAANKYRGMGTTIVCALVVPRSDRLHVAHVGNSRCYRFRQGYLDPLTQDHSLLADIVELRPDVQDEILARLPRKAVTRALGIEESLRVTVSTHHVALGDRLLLCSDGLTTEVGESLLAQLLAESSRPEDVVRELINLAKEAGGRDNIAVVVLDFVARAAGHPPQAVPAKLAGDERESAERSAARPPPLPRAPRRVPQSSAPEIEVTEHADGLDPEIVLIRAQELDEQDEDTNPRISVVPEQSADAAMLRALDHVADHIGQARSRCPQCNGEFEGQAQYCPHCGWAQKEPLLRQ